MGNLRLGSIYKIGWDNSTARIIGLDDIQVFYDGFWPHDNTWTFSGNFNKKCYFYSAPRSIFEARSTYLDFVPLTEQEHSAFRPDLLMRLAVTKELSWNNFGPSSLITLNDRSFLEQRLCTNRIVLIPSSHKGALKKGKIITSTSGDYFSCEELILKAKEVQESINSHKSNGIGIYRIGFESKLPSFYIGEFKELTKIFPV
jgi:hypothetical protein